MAPSSRRYVASRGARVGIALASAYTVCFILYAWTRVAFSLEASMANDPMKLPTLIAYAASLLVAASVIGAIFAIIAAIVGAFSGLLIGEALSSLDRSGDERKALVIGGGIAVCFVLLIDLAFHFHSLQLETFWFWFGLPSVIYISAACLAARRLALLRTNS
jgi:hypothetical protein